MLIHGAGGARNLKKTRIAKYSVCNLYRGSVYVPSLSLLSLHLCQSPPCALLWPYSHQRYVFLASSLNNSTSFPLSLSIVFLFNLTHFLSPTPLLPIRINPPQYQLLEHAGTKTRASHQPSPSPNSEAGRLVSPAPDRVG